MMVRIARVSAVCLAVLGLVISGAFGGRAGDQGISSRRPVSENGVGVGTNKDGPGEEVSVDAQGRPGAIVKPLAVFRAVQRGWSSGTPKPFEGYLGKGKVRLDFGEGGPRGGLYTRSQAYYLLTDYLRHGKTIGIRFLRIVSGDDGRSQPHALLERTCRYRSGVAGKEVVFISLRLEDGQWVISELRVIPAR